MLEKLKKDVKRVKKMICEQNRNINKEIENPERKQTNSGAEKQNN